MRAIIALVLAASLPAVAATAQVFDPAPDSVVRVDPAAVRLQTLADQQACSDVARHEAGDQVMIFTSASAPLTALAMSVASGAVVAAGVQGRYEKAIYHCMADRAYAPKPMEPGDDAAYRQALADGQRPDPYSLIVRFQPALSRNTTVVDARDASGQEVRTYTVGRF